MNHDEIITELQNLILEQLIKLPPGHVYSKAFLGIKSQIMPPYLEAVLKDLKSKELIEISPRTRSAGVFAGSGYQITSGGRKRINSKNYLARKQEYQASLERNKPKKEAEKHWLTRFFCKFG